MGCRGVWKWERLEPRVSRRTKGAPRTRGSSHKCTREESSVGSNLVASTKPWARPELHVGESRARLHIKNQRTELTQRPRRSQPSHWAARARGRSKPRSKGSESEPAPKPQRRWWELAAWTSLGRLSTATQAPMFPMPLAQSLITEQPKHPGCDPKSPGRERIRKVPTGTAKGSQQTPVR